MYAVLVSDPHARADRKVAGRSTRAGARKLARRRSAELVARRGGADRGTDGRPLPLYYVARVTESL